MIIASIPIPLLDSLAHCGMLEIHREVPRRPHSPNISSILRDYNRIRSVSSCAMTPLHAPSQLQNTIIRDLKFDLRNLVSIHRFTNKIDPGLGSILVDFRWIGRTIYVKIDIAIDTPPVIVIFRFMIPARGSKDRLNDAAV